MMYLIDLFEGITSMQLLSLAFLSVLFLQSGFDKVFDYQANYQWIKQHFEKSPLKKTVNILFPTITILEVLAGVFSLAGIFMLFLNGSTEIGLIGAQLSAICIITLFFGQRLAKDYQGAATLTPYFIFCIVAIYILS